MTVHKRLLSVVGGLKTFHYYDTATDLSWTSTEQDHNPIIDANKEMANDGDYSKQGIKKDWWHAARIPNALIMKWLIEDKINVFDPNHWPKVQKRLHDPDYRFLKTTAGKF